MLSDSTAVGIDGGGLRRGLGGYGFECYDSRIDQAVMIRETVDGKHDQRPRYSTSEEECAFWAWTCNGSQSG